MTLICFEFEANRNVSGWDPRLGRRPGLKQPKALSEGAARDPVLDLPSVQTITLNVSNNIDRKAAL